MLGCQYRQKPFKLSPGNTTSGDNGKLVSSSSTQHVSKVAKVRFDVQYCSIHIYLCGRSMVNWSGLITASSRTNIVWILNQSSSDTTALLVHLEPTLRALDIVHTNITRNRRHRVTHQSQRSSPLPNSSRPTKELYWVHGRKPGPDQQRRSKVVCLQRYTSPVICRRGRWHQLCLDPL